MSPHLANVKKKPHFFFRGSLILQMLSKFGSQSIRKAGLFTQSDKVYIVPNCKPISGLKILVPLLYARGTGFFVKTGVVEHLIMAVLSEACQITEALLGYLLVQESLISSHSLTFPQNR